jgi:hypothetical protein
MNGAPSGCQDDNTQGACGTCRSGGSLDKQSPHDIALSVGFLLSYSAEHEIGIQRKAVVRPERIVVVKWMKFPNFLQSNCLA